MSEYPEDVMKTARGVANDVMHAAANCGVDAVADDIARAIMTERQRLEEEIAALRRFRSFAIANTYMRDCPSCSGPRIGGYVCTHCGNDE